MGDKTLRFLVVFLTLFSVWVVVSNVRNVSEINKNHNHIVDSLKNELTLLKEINEKYESDSLFVKKY
jgi:hypothetical protein